MCQNTMQFISTLNQARNDKEVYHVSECQIKHWDQSLPCITCPDGKLSDTIENEVIDYYGLARKYNDNTVTNNSGQTNRSNQNKQVNGGSAILGGHVTRQLIGNKDKSDIDVVFYGLNKSQTYKLLNEIYADLPVKSSYFTQATYTVILKDGWIIQFILAYYPDFESIFQYIDVPSSAVLMDHNGDVWLSASGKLALEYGINWLNYDYLRANTNTRDNVNQPINNWSSTSWLRFAKYTGMGFDWVLPNLNLHKITLFDMHGNFEILSIDNYAVVCNWLNLELKMQKDNYSLPLELGEMHADYEIANSRDENFDSTFGKLFNQVFKAKVNTLFYPKHMTVDDFYGPTFAETSSIKPIKLDFDFIGSGYEPVNILYTHLYLTKGYIPDLIDDYRDMAFNGGIEVFHVNGDATNRDYNMLTEFMKIKNVAFQTKFVSNIIEYYPLKTIKVNTTPQFYNIFRRYLIDNYRSISLGRNADFDIRSFLS
jgi:hypothetical protein